MWAFALYFVVAVVAIAYYSVRLYVAMLEGDYAAIANDGGSIPIWLGGLIFNCHFWGKYFKDK